MARLALVVLPSIPHPISQRGTPREEVFFNEEDPRSYLEMVAETASSARGAGFWAWCRMPNHVHFVAVPEDERSLARCFGKAHRAYSRRANFRKGW